MASNRLAALQWSRHLAGIDGGARQQTLFEMRPAWVETRTRWLRTLSGASFVLEPRQARTLWHAIVADSNEASTLIDTQSIAEWARLAHALLAHYDIDLVRDSHEPGSATPEIAALRRWRDVYRDVLASRGWLDTEGALQRLERSGTERAPGRVRLLGCDDLTPLEQRCLEGLTRAGWLLRHADVPPRAGRAVRCGGSSILDELEQASAWCRERASANPRALIALVVPARYAPAATLERLLGDAPSVTVASGDPASRAPAVAAAINALTLLSPAGSTRELSHWLRSPFFHDVGSGEGAAAALAEAALRESLIAQLPVPVACREAGLLRSIAVHAPAVATRLELATARLVRTPRELSPARWTEVLRSCLRDLGWRAGHDPTLAAAGRALDLAFSELSKLTAVVPRLSLPRALAECRRIVDEPLVLPRMPVAGIHVLEHIDDVGPGYDAVWAVGFTASAWPERRPPNPMLPRALQRRRALPFASPEDALHRARRAIARIARIAPEVVLSWPDHDLEAPCLPSPLIVGLELATAHPQTPSQSDTQPAALEVCADRAPALAGRRIPGGATTLGQQARCPLRAFLERRLGARPLAPWARGVSARLRGIAAHRAAADLLPPTTTRTDLAALAPGERARRVSTAVGQALWPIFSDVDKRFELIRRLEHDRLTRSLELLVDAEIARGDFEVVACEAEALIGLGEREIRARLDRLDRLASGGLAVIDYKTGRPTSSPDWFGPILGDAQVPLYAAHVGASLAAALLCNLRTDGVRYRGVWRETDAFPGASLALPESLDWPGLHAYWSDRLSELAREFAAGDVRVRLEAAEELGGMLAPLTRVYELRALDDADEGLQ